MSANAETGRLDTSYLNAIHTFKELCSVLKTTESALDVRDVEFIPSYKESSNNAKLVGQPGLRGESNAPTRQLARVPCLGGCLDLSYPNERAETAYLDELPEVRT